MGHRDCNLRISEMTRHAKGKYAVNMQHSLDHFRPSFVSLQPSSNGITSKGLTDVHTTGKPLIVVVVKLGAEQKDTDAMPKKNHTRPARPTMYP